MLYKLFFFFYLFPFFATAESYPARPSNYVTDEAGILNSTQEQLLNDKLSEFEKSTTNQIFIYITPSLNGEEMSSLCQKIFHNWKIGSTKNNGLLIDVFVNDHKFRIHTGYGLEGVLPDLLTKQIQDEEMRPEFKNGNYFTGIDKGVEKLMYYSEREFKMPRLQPKPEPAISHWLIIAFIINVLFLLSLIYIVKYRSAIDTTLKKQLIGWGVFVSVFPVLGAMILVPFLFVAFGFDLKKIFRSEPYRKNYDTDDTYSFKTGWFDNNRSDSSSSSWESDSSSSSSDFDGGGGGDSGGGGSDSNW